MPHKYIVYLRIYVKYTRIVEGAYIASSEM